MAVYCCCSYVPPDPVTRSIWPRKSEETSCAGAATALVSMQLHAFVCEDYLRSVGLESVFAESSALLVPMFQEELFNFVQDTLSGILSLDLQQLTGPVGADSCKCMGRRTGIHDKPVKRLLRKS